MTSGPGSVRVEIDAHVGTLCFENPARHNALTIGMADGTRAALDRLARDPQVRVVVVRGAGDRAFMSGADIDEQGREPDRFRDTAQRMLDALASFEKPLVAMVHGFCLGGGMAVALRADIRLVAETATFGIPAARLGIAYGSTNVAALVALVGPSVAADLLLTARRMTAGEAYRVGLVNEVHPAGDLALVARARTAQIAAGAPLSQRASKAAIRACRPEPAATEALMLEELGLRCVQSEDYAEGQAAFHERREPRFSGR